MDNIYLSIWNRKFFSCEADPEQTRNCSKTKSSRTTSGLGNRGFTVSLLAFLVSLAFGSNVYALPAGGNVAAGSATIASGAAQTTITQSTQNVVVNWQSFNIAAGEAVSFIQPNTSSVALNRVMGADPTSIFGSLSSNGKVFLVNPNGILFGRGASVNVGGLVASGLNIADADFMAGRYKFSGLANGTILNQGSITADGGYIALLGSNISNEGIISAKLGNIALAAGNAITLDMAGDGLLNVLIEQGAVNALVQNSGMIQATGGQVILTAQAAGSLLKTVVNNTGIIEAQTLENHNGTIKLLGDMQSGTVNLSGTLDASAPNGGNGGFIETSAATVNISNDANVSTFAPMGLTGLWLIDPQDFIIGSGSGDNISGATLSNLLVTNSVTISTIVGTSPSTVAGTPPVTTFTSDVSAPGNGDIFVNDAVSWTATPSTTTLTLLATRDVNINQAITATNGNLVVCCGRDINVNAAITTTNGSTLLSAGRNFFLNSTPASITVTDGNLLICAANDIFVNGAITLTRGSSIPSQSLQNLGVQLGLVFNAGYGGTGPGVAGGTLIFGPSSPLVTVTGPNAPVSIFYNPISYTTPTNYTDKFTLSLGATLTQFMLVFPGAEDKVFDGTTTVPPFTFLKGNPAGVSLVNNPGSSAAFDTSTVGMNKTVTFSGYSLAGANASDYAFAVSCCSPIVGRTTANIVAATGSPVPITDLPVPITDLLVARTAGLVPSSGSLLSPSGWMLPLTGTALGFGVMDSGINVPSIQLTELTPIITQPEILPIPEVAPRDALPAPVEAPPAIIEPLKRPYKQDRN